jgi:ketosteroid isomerase-like protein
LAFGFGAEGWASAADDVAGVLQRQTQELVDAIATGSAAVWDKYLDKDLRYVDESGRVLTKKQMLEDIKPLPGGVSGTIRVTDFDAVVHGNVAVATYVNDEDEDFHGHKVHCQYRTTDTWKKTPKGWRLIAAQVLALRTDPPSVPLTARLKEEYSGRYALTPQISYEIRPAGEELEGQQTGRPAQVLRAEAPDVLFVPGRPRYRKIFLRGPDGRVTGFAERREAWDIVWSRLP